MHRGARAIPGRYFGPYPSAGAVRETLNLMHQLFRLRSCEDSVFRNRSRPVPAVPDRTLQRALRRAGAGARLRRIRAPRRIVPRRPQRRAHATNSTRRWRASSARLDFEEAARIRDLIGAIRKLQARQYVDGRAADLDVLACAMQGSSACVLLLAFRDGRNLGTRAFFPKTNGAENPAEVLAAFVSQYYAEQPRAAARSCSIATSKTANCCRKPFSLGAGKRVVIKCSVRGERAGYLDLAQPQRGAGAGHRTGQPRVAAGAAGIAARPAWPCGAAVAHRVLRHQPHDGRGDGGVVRRVRRRTARRAAQYRRYNIAGIEPGDDYAAMHQALERRFRKAVEEDGMLPDVLLIDGGAGQVAQARAVLADLGIDGIALVGVAKGEARRAGHETLLLPDGREVRPGPESPGLQLVQQVRDEAHRFAITGHRGRRAEGARTPAGWRTSPASARADALTCCGISADWAG